MNPDIGLGGCRDQNIGTENLDYGDLRKAAQETQGCPQENQKGNERDAKEISSPVDWTPNLMRRLIVPQLSKALFEVFKKGNHIE